MRGDNIACVMHFLPLLLSFFLLAFLVSCFFVSFCFCAFIFFFNAYGPLPHREGFTSVYFKNLWYLFIVSLAPAGVWSLLMGPLALLVSLFNVIRELDRFLHFERDTETKHYLLYHISLRAKVQVLTKLPIGW